MKGTYIWQIWAVILSAAVIASSIPLINAGYWFMGILAALAVRMNYKIFTDNANIRKQLLAKKRT